LILFVLLGFMVSVPSVFAFSGNDQKAIDNLSKENKALKLEIDDLKGQYLKMQSSQSLYDSVNQKLIEGVNIKNEGVDFKSHYYDSVITLFSIFGFLILAVAIILGLVKGKEIKDARKEMKDDFKIINDRYSDFEKTQKEKIDQDLSKMKSEKEDFLKGLSNEFKEFQLNIRKRLIEQNISSDGGIVVDDSSDEKDNEEIKF